MAKMTFEQIKEMKLKKGMEVEFKTNERGRVIRGTIAKIQAKRGKLPKYFSMGRWHEGKVIQYYEISFDNVYFNNEPYIIRWPDGTEKHAGLLEETFYSLVVVK